MKPNKDRLYIGLVGVCPAGKGSGCLGKAKGAYVNALTFASTKADFQKRIKEALESLGLLPFEFEDIELFDERAQRRELGVELEQMAEEAQQSGTVKFGEFHCFEKMDA